MPTNEEVWIGPADDEEMAGLERWSKTEYDRCRKVRIGPDESWVVLDEGMAEWSSLHLRRHDFDLAGSFADVRRREASRRLEELEWRGLAPRFREELCGGVLTGSRSAWMSRAVPCEGFFRVDYEKRFATPFRADFEPLASILRRVEEENGVTVYHVIWEVRKGVELYELLFASSACDAWVRERDSVSCGWADAFVVNPAEDNEEVKAKIGIEIVDGCLLRRWPEEGEHAARRAAAAVSKIGKRAAAAMDGLRQQP